MLLVVLWRLRYKLSLRDLAEMFLERGFVFSHETVRDWEARFAPLLADHLRAKRRGQAGASWYVDETDVKVAGSWCYLYRAVDRDGNVVDARLSETREMEGAQRFFHQAVATVGHCSDRVTTDGHDAYPRAVRETLGDDVAHRCSRYLNNRIEQDHRGIKQRYYPMRGFGSVASAARCCPAFEEQRSTSGPAAAWASGSRWRSNAGSFASGGRPWWARSWRRNKAQGPGEDGSARRHDLSCSQC